MSTVKYHPDEWVDLAKATSAPCPQNFQIRLHQPGAVEVDLGSGFRNIGYGTEFKIQLPHAGKVKCSQPSSIFVGMSVETHSQGVPLTNFDKRPGMSSVERMVKQTIMESRLKDKLAREQRLELDREHNQNRVDRGLQDENPIPPEPEPVPVEVIESTDTTPEAVNPTA